eukprot:Protomagalhaensia_sp_Gyna_25__4024@NODE_362_length_3715_cov_57_036181_g279_i0_p2_GENE_NODE_362_length_3715_cov_57_036181_g279_i0NODE_362_length_3715_cov_57_036181_g279_i0_p2_ORF_typecomplete_len468_score30_60RRM_1/PF00076_22/0_0017Nup35_RRM_2/PF14605_6/0_0025Nup35_RRM/PF05172_13/0_0059zfRING_5/PF14634_6/0_06zfC3HC4_3/PF13920_6/4_2zfRING_4/PF14570_6/0_13zfRING_4/PF14570_6/1e04_NODE_362_length_3715_cov_57_036181_g279_i022533656
MQEQATCNTCFKAFKDRPFYPCVCKVQVCLRCYLGGAAYLPKQLTCVVCGRTTEEANSIRLQLSALPPLETTASLSESLYTTSEAPVSAKAVDIHSGERVDSVEIIRFESSKKTSASKAGSSRSRTAASPKPVPEVITISSDDQDEPAPRPERVVSSVKAVRQGSLQTPSQGTSPFLLVHHADLSSSAPPSRSSAAARIMMAGRPKPIATSSNESRQQHHRSSRYYHFEEVESSSESSGSEKPPRTTGGRYRRRRREPSTETDSSSLIDTRRRRQTTARTPAPRLPPVVLSTEKDDRGPQLYVLIDTVAVSGLPVELYDQAILSDRFFGRYGTILNHKVNHRQRSCEITYASEDEAKAAVRDAHRALLVDYSGERHHCYVKFPIRRLCRAIQKGKVCPLGNNCDDLHRPRGTRVPTRYALTGPADFVTELIRVIKDGWKVADSQFGREPPGGTTTTIRAKKSKAMKA